MHLIYGLYKGEELVYVGRTIRYNNLMGRISYHRRNNKDFDSYRYVAFGNYEETKEEERRLIKLLEPKYNKQCVPGKIKYPGLRSYKG